MSPRLATWQWRPRCSTWSGPTAWQRPRRALSLTAPAFPCLPALFFCTQGLVPYSHLCLQVDEARARAQALTSILAQKKEEEAQQQQQGGEQPGGAGAHGGPGSTPAGGGAADSGGGGGGGGFGSELEALFGPNRFPDLLKELLGAPVQVGLGAGTWGRGKGVTAER